MAKKPTYEELVPDDVRKLAEGVGLPEPTWYDGRTNGHEVPEENEVESTGASDSPHEP
jgi:uncharacterized protein YodC (DUF2158 family)